LSLLSLGYAFQAKTLENPVGNEYLNSSVLPTLPPPNDMPQPLDRRDSLPPLPPRNKQEESSTPSQSTSKTNPLKHNPSTASVYRQAVGGVPPSKRRLAGIGVSSSHGRLFKVLADFFLLSGRTGDALVWYLIRILNDVHVEDQVLGITKPWHFLRAHRMLFGMLQL
jgi:trafficking protein particle complex subunit 9